MTKCGYYNRPCFKYAQISFEVLATSTIGSPPYNQRCNKYAPRVKAYLESEHTISPHRPLSKFEPRLANYRNMRLI